MRRSILYLDDEAGCLAVFYERFGVEYDVRVALSAAEARRKLAERAADVVISDQSMPDVSGIEFLRQAAAAHPESYRVLLTGTATVGGVYREILDGTVHAFVTKPWAEPDMRAALERAATWLDSRAGEKRGA